MSALKFQPSLRYINSYKKSPHICSLTTCHNIVTCHNGSLSSSLPGGGGTRNQQKDANNETVKNESKITNNENNKDSPLSHQVLEKDSGSFGKFVPLRMAEVNKYFAETSRRLLRTRFNKGLSNIVNNINNNNNDNSNSDDKKPFEERNVNTYSFEQTMMKMNQSVVSFYDTSCAKESFQDQIVNQQKELEIQDDNQPQIPRYVGPLFPPKFPPEVKKKRAEARRAEKISRLSLESRTKALVQSLRKSHSLMSKLTRAEELCDHLIAHPECVWDAAKEKTVPLLLSLTNSPDKNLTGIAYQCLSLLGHAKQLTSPGIRILSLDGGGTRGLVTIEFLKALEKESGKKIHEMFDYVCGVSTGALLAVMICLYKLPLDRCEALYKDCSIRTFNRNRLVGTTKLVWNHGFYDSSIWEHILQNEFGSKMLIEFARENDVPQMSAVSSLISAPKMTSHLFRTYNPPYGVQSKYPGSSKYKIWEVIRASSAAPGYFEPFQLDEDVHEDGGILNNNPTALAIHESRLLWDRENIHCVVSLGTGRFRPTIDSPAKPSLKKRLSTIIDSATDTEAVHHTLQDLLPAKTYFRFNPYLSEEFFLDEIRQEKMDLMQHDAQMYARRNSYKVIAASQRLVEKRKPQQRLSDWLRDAVEKI